MLIRPNFSQILKFQIRHKKYKSKLGKDIQLSRPSMDLILSEMRYILTYNWAGAQTYFVTGDPKDNLG